MNFGCKNKLKRVLNISRIVARVRVTIISRIVVRVRVTIMIDFRFRVKVKVRIRSIKMYMNATKD